jgi:phosphatidylinositol-3-phosphatase
MVERNAKPRNCQLTAEFFQDVQQGTNPLLSYSQMGGFDGGRGLWSDLASGKVPNFSYIVPNQRNDQHGRMNFLAVSPE